MSGMGAESHLGDGDRRGKSSKETLHEKIVAIATEISEMIPDPLYPHLTPKGIVVGSYARDLNTDGKDVDFEIYGITSDYLIEQVPKLQCFKDQILHTEIRGNAYKALSLTLTDGSRIEFSVPVLEPSPPQRFNPSTLVEAPDATFEEAAQRRRFTIDAFGYDPLTNTKLDPFDGSKDLEDKTLRPLTPWFFSDPILLPHTIRLLAKDGWKASEDLERILKSMVRTPGDRSHENFREFRYRYEISCWFVSDVPPSAIIRKAEEYGFLTVEVPTLDHLRTRYSIWTPILELMDKAWEESKESKDLEAVSIGKQIGILYGGVVEADRIIFNHLTREEIPSHPENRPLNLIALAKALVPQGDIRVDESAIFEEVLEVAANTANQIIFVKSKAQFKETKQD